MARLNEPMVSTDSIETLRRKFLRQNRDIARVNSTQSLKIRTLENECVRLLSENLDLRGQILRLQTELEDNKAQKIADHALEIKEKMEAQLAEWGSMLASLGHEPIRKSRSPREAKRAKHRSSIGRISMSEWKRRDTVSSMKDLEAAALQEGRLAPIWENKTCPRETLSREEIIALRSVVDDNDDSPDLGPPPVSRFVDEDPVKIDLPTRTNPSKSDWSSLEDTSSEPASKKEPPIVPKMDRKIDDAVNDVTSTKVEPKEAKAAAVPDPQPTTQVAKANLKRKLREEDEKENAVVSKPAAQTVASEKEPEKPTHARARPGSRMLKLSANRKDPRDQPSDPLNKRRPLGAKNSNECIKSPKKTTKPPVDEEIAKEDIKAKKDPTPVVEVPVPEPSQPVVVTDVEIETETLSAEPNLAIPNTPEPTPREEARDTPPPTDISSRETSRGSRRARAAVSYAEPNLRDKMRRPTKQLLDAVSGEGKHIRRASHSKKDEFPSSGPSSGPSSIVSSEGKTQWKEIPSINNALKSTSDVTASPLARKGLRATLSSNELPTSVVMERKNRNSTINVSTSSDPESSAPSSSDGNNPTKSSSRSINRRLDEIAAREAEVAKIFDDEQDVYEFTSPSSKNGSKQKNAIAPEEPAKKNHGKVTRRSRVRRLSSILHEDQDHGSEELKGPRFTGSSRRATVAASKESKPEVENQGPDSSLEGDSLSSNSSAEINGSAQDRNASRRRSMML